MSTFGELVPAKVIAKGENLLFASSNLATYDLSKLPGNIAGPLRRYLLDIQNPNEPVVVKIERLLSALPRDAELPILAVFVPQNLSIYDTDFAAKWFGAFERGAISKEDISDFVFLFLVRFALQESWWSMTIEQLMSRAVVEAYRLEYSEYAFLIEQIQAAFPSSSKLGREEFTGSLDRITEATKNGASFIALLTKLLSDPITPSILKFGAPPSQYQSEEEVQSGLVKAANWFLSYWSNPERPTETAQPVASATNAYNPFAWTIGFSQLNVTQYEQQLVDKITGLSKPEKKFIFEMGLFDRFINDPKTAFVTSAGEYKVKEYIQATNPLYLENFLNDTTRPTYLTTTLDALLEQSLSTPNENVKARAVVLGYFESYLKAHHADVVNFAFSPFNPSLLDHLKLAEHGPDFKTIGDVSLVEWVPELVRKVFDQNTLFPWDDKSRNNLMSILLKNPGLTSMEKLDYKTYSGIFEKYVFSNGSDYISRLNEIDELVAKRLTPSELLEFKPFEELKLPTNPSDNFFKQLTNYFEKNKVLVEQINNQTTTIKQTMQTFFANATQYNTLGDAFAALEKATQIENLRVGTIKTIQDTETKFSQTIWPELLKIAKNQPTTFDLAPPVTEAVSKPKVATKVVRETQTVTTAQIPSLNATQPAGLLPPGYIIEPVNQIPPPQPPIQKLYTFTQNATTTTPTSIAATNTTIPTTTSTIITTPTPTPTPTASSSSIVSSSTTTQTSTVTPTPKPTTTPTPTIPSSSIVSSSTSVKPSTTTPTPKPATTTSTIQTTPTPTPTPIASSTTVRDSSTTPLPKPSPVLNDAAERLRKQYEELKPQAIFAKIVPFQDLVKELESKEGWKPAALAIQTEYALCEYYATKPNLENPLILKKCVSTFNENVKEVASALALNVTDYPTLILNATVPQELSIVPVSSGLYFARTFAQFVANGTEPISISQLQSCVTNITTTLNNTILTADVLAEQCASTLNHQYNTTSFVVSSLMPAEHFKMVAAFASRMEMQNYAVVAVGVAAGIYLLYINRKEVYKSSRQVYKYLHGTAKAISRGPDEHVSLMVQLGEDVVFKKKVYEAAISTRNPTEFVRVAQINLEQYGRVDESNQYEPEVKLATKIKTFYSVLSFSKEEIERKTLLLLLEDAEQKVQSQNMLHRFTEQNAPLVGYYPSSSIFDLGKEKQKPTVTHSIIVNKAREDFMDLINTVKAALRAHTQAQISFAEFIDVIEDSTVDLDTFFTYYYYFIAHPISQSPILFV
jgi:hypothetical protein